MFSNQYTWAIIKTRIPNSEPEQLETNQIRTSNKIYKGKTYQSIIPSPSSLYVIEKFISFYTKKTLRNLNSILISMYYYLITILSVRVNQLMYS